MIEQSVDRTSVRQASHKPGWMLTLRINTERFVTTAMLVHLPAGQQPLT